MSSLSVRKYSSIMHMGKELVLLPAHSCAAVSLRRGTGSNRPSILFADHSCKDMDELHLFLRPSGHQYSLMSCAASRPGTHLEQHYVSFVAYIKRWQPKGINLMAKVLLLLGQGLGAESVEPCCASQPSVSMNWHRNRHQAQSCCITFLRVGRMKIHRR